MRLPPLERLKLDTLVLLIGDNVQRNQDISDEGVGTSRCATLSQNCSNPKTLFVNQKLQWVWLVWVPCC